MRKLDSP